jgi:hypothetical protein
LNHKSLDVNEVLRITRSANEMEDTKLKKGMKNTKERSIK